MPPAVSDLRRRGKLWLHLVSLQAGSVVATLRLTVQDPEFPLQVSTLSPMLGPLWASTVFQIDRQGTQVQGTGRPLSPHGVSSLPQGFRRPSLKGNQARGVWFFAGT